MFKQKNIQMKKIVYLTLIFLLFFTKGLNAQKNWDYTVYKTITNGGVKLFTLEYGINPKGYNGYVKWRLTNHTNKTIYDVSINDKTYTLSDGRVATQSGESMANTIGPGGFGTTMPDPVNSSEYALNSDKNFENPVKSLSVEYPEIKFKDKDGNEYSWDSFNNQRSNTENSNSNDSENTSVNDDYKQKRSEYLDLIRQGDQAFNNGNWREASNKYYKAMSLDFDPDMHPSLPTTNSVRQKWAQANRNINNSEKKSNNNQGEKNDKKPSSPNSRDEDTESSTEDETEDSEDSDPEIEESEEDNSYKHSRVNTEAETLAREEFERQQREYEFHKEKLEQNARNAEIGGAMAGSMFYALYQGASIMYQGMGYDDKENIFFGNSSHFNVHVGYTSTYAPIYFNSERASYDGNNHSTKTFTKNYHTSTINIEAGLEYWPLYGEKAGIGAFGSGLAGAGIFFQNNHLSAFWGLKGFWGTENIRLYGEVSKGYRQFKARPWMDSYESGEGLAKYTYTRFGLGPSITFDAYFEGFTRANLSVFPIFELPDFIHLNHSNKPLLYNWMNGIHANLYFENRIKFYTEVMWNYTRTGEIDYTIDKDITTPAGVFIKLGAVRMFDFFGKSAHSYDFEVVKKMCSMKNKWYVHFAGPEISWFNTKKDSSFFVSNYRLGINLIGLEKDFNLTNHYSLYTGGSFSIGRGGIIRPEYGNSIIIGNTSYSNYVDVKIKYMSINVPFGLRLSSNKSGKDVFWLRAGISNEFLLGQKIFAKTDLDEGKFKEQEERDIFRTYIPVADFGCGLDFPFVDQSLYRVGAYYKYGLKNILSYGPTDLRNNRVSFTMGFVF